MTIDEILAREIPEGKYHLAMKAISAELIFIKTTLSHGDYGSAKPLVDSYCVSFEALYALAKGELPGIKWCDCPKCGTFINTTQIYKSDIKKAWQASRTKALDEVVEMLQNRVSELATRGLGPEIDGIEEAIKEIRSMPGAGEDAK